MPTPPAWQLPWAKLGRAEDKKYPGDAHPVACHLLDVAHVAGVLWSKCLAASVRGRWAAALGLPERDAGRWIAFWAGCHDIGKACPGFQNLDHSGNAEATLASAGLQVGPAPPVRHDHVSAHVLPDIWTQAQAWPQIDKKLARSLAAVIGGHHGIIPTSSEYGPASHCFMASHLGSEEWTEVRKEILSRLAGAIGVENCAVPQTPTGADRGFSLVLAGLISVADWIGSNREFFEPKGFPADWDAYVEESRQQAEGAVDALGWTGWRAERTEAVDFRALFEFEETRPLQDVVERLVNDRIGPALLLVEGPMGEGKTEAAIYAADRHTHERGGRGMYVALPTTATSNGMFSRVEEFLRRRYPASDQRVNLQLLHGRTFLSDNFEKLRISAVGEDLPDQTAQVVAEEWFARDKKQGLLAPFAVGTIDQALLSVLQTKFGFVRLFGLAGKTVILDEVHAYDAYTSTILGRMLAWLNAIGSPVVLLSATLPRTTRRRLLAEYLHFDLEQPIDMTSEDDARTYPRVTVACSDSSRVLVEQFPADPQRNLEIQLQTVERSTFADRLRAAVGGGGTVAVICNTVNCAQAVYRELRDRFSGERIELGLFHARFPLGDRQRIEDRVLKTYGKGHRDRIRPPRVLVATQVVEQSLDLDFDLMVTEYAPVDLILQRAGRLHRHERKRPDRFIGNPEFWLLNPDGETDGVPDFGAFEDTVYARHILLRSYLALNGRRTIKLPGDIEELVESVYADDPPIPEDAAWAAALEQSREAYESAKRDSEANAKGALVRPADSGSLLRQCSRDLEEDDPGAFRTEHGRKVAKTREGDPTVEVVLLYRVGESLSLTADGSQPIELSQQPRGEGIRQIVERSVSLSHRSWVSHFAAQDVPTGWQRCGALRFHRVAELDLNSEYHAGSGILCFDETIGVELLRNHD